MKNSMMTRNRVHFWWWWQYRLAAKLDIVVSRKIEAPHNSELAIGAVMHDGSFYPNQDIISKLTLSQEYIDEHISIQRKEIERRLMRFRGSNR